MQNAAGHCVKEDELKPKQVQKAYWDDQRDEKTIK